MAAGLKASSRSAPRTRAPCSRRSVPRLARSTTPYTLDQFVEELVDPAPGLAAVPVHKRRRRSRSAGAWRSSRMSGRGTPRRARSRSSRRTPRGDRCGARARPRRRGLTSACRKGLRRSSASGRGAFAVIDVGTNSVKFHSASAPPTGPGRRSSTAPRSLASAKACTRTGGSATEPIAADGRRPRGMVDEARGAWGPGDRGRGHGRPADGLEQRRVPRRGARVQRRRGRGDPAARRRPGSRYLAATAGLPRSAMARRSCSTRAAAAPSSRSGTARSHRGAVQPERRRRALSPSASASTGSPGDVLAAALEAIAADLAPLDGRPASGCAGRSRRRGHQHGRCEHGLATYDPKVVQGTVLDRAEIDRQIELYRTSDRRGAPRDPRASSRSAPR